MGKLLELKKPSNQKTETIDGSFSGIIAKNVANKKRIEAERKKRNKEVKRNNRLG